MKRSLQLISEIFRDTMYKKIKFNYSTVHTLKNQSWN